MTWNLTQTGTSFTGAMQLAGHHGGTMTVSGTRNGRTGTFTMTFPAGSMMGRTCAATATGTFDMDEMVKEVHATYGGTNSCGEPFSHGQMSMIHR